jgi:hypothetical protein
MKNKSPRTSFLNRGALLAITVQLLLGTTGAMASSDQTLMNTSLPLPDAATTKTTKKAAAPLASRLFERWRKPSAPAGEATPAAATPAPSTPAAVTAPPVVAPAAAPVAELRPAISVPEGSAPAAEKLETNASWLEDEKKPMAELERMAAPPSVVTAAPKAEEPKTEKIEKTEATIPTNTFKLSEPIKQNSSMALLPTSSAKTVDTVERGYIFIDNDEAVEQEATIQYEDLPLDDETKTKVKAGARFPIVITSEVTSRTAKVGDPVQGRLKYDLKIGDRLVAQKGSVVRGHLNYALRARTPMASLVSANRWYKNSGCLGIAFDEIINEKAEHIPLVAEPSKSPLYVKNKAEGRVLGINHKGQIAGPWSQQLQYKAIRVGMNFAMAPLGAMSFGAMPVALGVIGAVNPSFAFMKPVGTNVRHRRIKGFAWGFLSGVPGSWLIEDTTIKGQEAVIKPGDEFLAEMRQEFTGEPATEAEMLGGADGKVHGEVVGAKNNKLEKTRTKKRASRVQPAA